MAAFDAGGMLLGRPRRQPRPRCPSRTPSPVRAYPASWFQEGPSAKPSPPRSDAGDEEKALTPRGKFVLAKEGRKEVYGGEGVQDFIPSKIVIADRGRGRGMGTVSEEAEEAEEAEEPAEADKIQ
mmetsp:Transcript_33057/g.87391  ORF Transcript_33057/g.87391 Transcript_33057/m.87391 type:complete len:125 (+) Transcript_33057:67-441(+)